MSDYRAFIEAKVAQAKTWGFDVDPDSLNPILKPHQRALTTWALRKGRAALFADTGLGKTFMQLEWARALGKKTLILAPLSIAKQTVREAEKLDIECIYARRQDQAGQITITNYEMIEHFDPAAFEAIVLDESSILKATEGVYRNKLNEAFEKTPYRLCCTATPAPNDIQELTNHSAFLSVMRRRDVLATYFLHESNDARASGWRLKGHAREAFWRWLASWAMSLKRPSDLGFSDEGYVLPPLTVTPVVVDTDYVTPGKLFADRMQGITERSAIRRQTLSARASAAAGLIAAEPGEAWIAWVGLNDEADAMRCELGGSAVEVKGSDSPEKKAELLEAFVAGQIRTLITKTAIAGFGMNFQHCARQVFVGINDSYEQYYQAIRRSWRFGQTRPVAVSVVISEPERDVYDNVLRKEREAEEMATELVRHVVQFEREELGAAVRSDTGYLAHKTFALPAWLQ